MPDYLDGCPECMYRNNAPVDIETVPNGVRCAYRCGNCDGEWTTSYWTYDDKEGD